MKPKTVKIKLIRKKTYPGSLHNTNNLTSLSIYLHIYKVTYIHIMSERERRKVILKSIIVMQYFIIKKCVNGFC